MGLKLFDDDGSGEENEKLNKIEINPEFARRYQRLEELKKKGVIDSDSDSDSDSDESSSFEVEEEEEEEENADLSKKKDLEFFDALIRVRNKDPILKNKGAKLFQSEFDSVSEEEDEDDDGSDNNNHGNGNNGSENKGNNKVKKDGEKKEERKPLYLKDVVSKHLSNEGLEFDDADDNMDWEEGEELCGGARGVEEGIFEGR